ncbi:MAG: MBL fold metallo-hydrolase RNA specificity domain-containing protein [Bacteroidota bacterium]
MAKSKRIERPVEVQFLGGAGTVTGSKYLLHLPERTVLVDCGLFQGLKSLRKRNWDSFPYAASKIDDVLLTHGHLDHTGYLPRLVRHGFKGRILGTQPTLEVTEIILRDSARLQEQEAEKANREGYSKHHPADPFYGEKEVEQTLPLFESVREGTWQSLTDRIRVRFRYVGHILGASFLELELDGKRMVFSGDVGRSGDPLLHDPHRPEQADVLFLESTYGDRHHPELDLLDELERVTRETFEAGGTLIIPSFAVERAQLLMVLFWQLDRQGRLPSPLPIVLDSPMGARVLELFRIYDDWHRLTDNECDEVCRRTHVVGSYNETRELVKDDNPKVVIAGSGMVTGGRVLTYLNRLISKKETTVLLSGFQAAGTRGRQLQEGADEIKFHGNWHPVRARIEMLEGLSGHADQTELLDWVSELSQAPKETFLIHGEPHALDALRVKLADRFGWDPHIPELNETVTIDLS